MCHEVAPSVQGQARTQEGGHAHLCQEKAGGAEQRAGSHEEGGSQGLMHPLPINNHSYQKKEIAEATRVLEQTFLKIIYPAFLLLFSSS